MPLNLAECFFHRADQQPDHPLILGQDAGRATSYAGFRDEVQQLARQLAQAGVERGDNIGLHHRSGRDYIAFIYAVWTCGACVTPLPLELTAAEKREVFQHIHIDAVISGAEIVGQLMDCVESPVPLTPAAVFARAHVVCAPPSPLAAVNAAFIRFTSGTTGDAKGVVLSHEAIHARILAANRALQIGAQDRVLWLLSMDYHFAVSIGAYLTLGASIILPKNSFGVTLLGAASRHQATIIYGAPMHYNLMTQDDTGAALPAALRLAIVTTTALSSAAADAFHARFGQVLNEAYGIIELGLPAINVSNLRSKQGSVGKVLPDYELRLDCAEGADHGEIMVRGDGMLDAYYSPWRSREVILQQNGGWFRTGDLGRIDADGFLYIVGRLKEMISIGGLKFFPAEVESVLEGHPAIRAACVFGTQERQWGATTIAHLVLAEGHAAPDEQELRAHCRRALASYKIPGRFSWVEGLTYTASGKKIRNAEKLVKLESE
jgi:long-chain acyl-CoA synthetase